MNLQQIRKHFKSLILLLLLEIVISSSFQSFIAISIADADGIILGSPTYASNVSSQMKVIIDRGHFVMEHLLYGKYAISVSSSYHIHLSSCVQPLPHIGEPIHDHLPWGLCPTLFLDYRHHHVLLRMS